MSAEPDEFAAFTGGFHRFFILFVNIGIVTREVRQEVVPLDDAMAIKAKNMKLSRLRQAEMVIQAFCKKHKLPL